MEQGDLKMTDELISAGIDDATAQAVRQISKADERTISQVSVAGIRAMTRLSTSARKLLYSIDETLTDAEIEYVMRTVGRSLIAAQRKVLMDRYADNIEIDFGDSGAGQLTEEQIEEIAVQACK